VVKVFSFFSDKILHQQKKQAASKAGEKVGIPGSIMPGDSSLLLCLLLSILLLNALGGHEASNDAGFRLHCGTDCDQIFAYSGT
jgi:hypothetical protein